MLKRALSLCAPYHLRIQTKRSTKIKLCPCEFPGRQSGSNRPLVDLYVEGGARDDHDRNDCEAQAIAEEIVAILKDEKWPAGPLELYRSSEATKQSTLTLSSMGSATLQSCIEESSYAAMRAAFQGSERHIMFLSLVADPTNCKPLREICSTSDLTWQLVAHKIECTCSLRHGFGRFR